jgi:hypothetical protein
MALKANPVRRVAKEKAGRYADGAPLDRVQYLESKIILKPDRFTSVEAFWEFAKIVRRTARKTDVGFSTKEFEHERPQIREVVFLDTEDFRLYNNAFILRRRIPYRDGFPVGDPEIVFKFRHPDLQRAARTDVRPRIDGDSRIKFKAEALPLKDQVGAVRMLFSHNVEFPLSHVHEGDRTSMETVARVLPALARLKRRKGERIELVNQTIVEEVLQDIGMLDFGKGIGAKANVALWRARGDHAPLVGEFAYQIKFKKRGDLHAKAMRRAEQFFVSLQHEAASWLLLGATKTGIVYRLKGNPPQAHE